MGGRLRPAVGALLLLLRWVPGCRARRASVLSGLKSRVLRRVGHLPARHRHRTRPAGREDTEPVPKRRHTGPAQGLQRTVTTEVLRQTGPVDCPGTGPAPGRHTAARRAALRTGPGPTRPDLASGNRPDRGRTAHLPGRPAAASGARAIPGGRDSGRLRPATVRRAAARSRAAVSGRPGAEARAGTEQARLGSCAGGAGSCDGASARAAEPGPGAGARLRLSMGAARRRSPEPEAVPGQGPVPRAGHRRAPGPAGQSEPSAALHRAPGLAADPGPERPERGRRLQAGRESEAAPGARAGTVLGAAERPGPGEPAGA